jgi:peptide methionine sulfoxide reductase MsrA
MFETRRYTKIIEAFWDQHKEYTKEIKETKKSLEYLKRLYDDDNKRKMKALREMEAVAEKAAELPAMQQKLQSLSRNYDPAETMRKKYLLGLSRGTLKEKHSTTTRTIQELKDKMREI